MPAQLTSQRAQDFYGEHKGKSFFDTLVNFMTSGPVYALVLAKQNAIKEWRSLMGPTNSNTARAEKPKRYSNLEQLQIIAGLRIFFCSPCTIFCLRMSRCLLLMLQWRATAFNFAVCGLCMERMALRMRRMVQILLQVQPVRSASSSLNLVR